MRYRREWLRPDSSGIYHSPEGWRIHSVLDRRSARAGSTPYRAPVELEVILEEVVPAK